MFHTHTKYSNRPARCLAHLVGMKLIFRDVTVVEFYGQSFLFYGFDEDE